MAMTEPPRPMLRRVLVHPRKHLDDLLTSISDGRVVPIVGPELLQVEVNGQTVPLYDYLARRLAEDFELALPEPFTLQDLAAVYLRESSSTPDGDPERLYTRIFRILQGQSFTVPAALEKLAGIGRFPLFITTTFDSLLAEAVAKARGVPVREVVYSGTRSRGDLEEGWDAGTPTVFYLMGRASSAPNYVVSEEDSLEFLTRLQADAPQMRLFFEALAGKHLLILGCSFPDWLARFFIRMAKGEQLSKRRSAGEWLADNRSKGDGSLALFLDNFSANTRVFTVSAPELVDQLAALWEERYAPRPQPGPSLARPKPEEGKGDEERSEGEIPEGALLISYARQDTAAAERLREGLSTVTDVWFDRADLEVGDDWDAKIRRTIRKCSLFVPVLSRNAARRMEGYFRREWNRALDRREGMAPELPFILPVVVDDLPPESAGVPPAFWAAQAALLPGGEATDSFLAQVAVKLRIVRRALRG